MTTTKPGQINYCPPTYIWLTGLAYRMDLSVWPFAIAMAISMFITLATVSLRSYNAAVANTVDALKYE